MPLGELLHPVPLLALGLLVINDWVLKGGGLIPGIVTGKLSDLAGLLFFPLLLTAGLDLGLLGLARCGWQSLDFSLRRWKLVAACGLTAAVFSAIKLIPGAAEGLVGALNAVGLPSSIVCDPTDLVALPMVLYSYRLGAHEIARVPLGRLEVIERRFADHPDPAAIAAELEDVCVAGAGRDATRQLATGLADFLRSGAPEVAAQALRSIRAPTAAPACPPSEPPSDQTQTEHRTTD